MTGFIEFQAVHNFRDLGGHRAADGMTVRSGQLFRSDSLGKLSDADLVRFNELRIRTVIDLRYGWEADAGGRIRPETGVTYHGLSIEHRPYDQPRLGADVDPADFLPGKYAEVAADGVSELREALSVIADDSAPLVFHCTSGKDRTGLLAALVLALLGVSESDIIADYALTERATAKLVADWRAAHPGRELWPGYGRAPAEVMRRVLVDMDVEYGGLVAYAHNRLGIDDVFVRRLRDRLLES